jgi:hypothetical protein
MIIFILNTFVSLISKFVREIWMEDWMPLYGTWNDERESKFVSFERINDNN